MPGSGFLNYSRRSGLAAPRAGYRRVVRVRFAKGSTVGKAVSTSYRKMRARIAPVVKSILRRQEETKSLGATVENGTPHNAQITNADIQPLLSGMLVGPTNGQRIGDKIKAVSLKVKGCVSYYDRGQAAVQMPMIVKVFCLQWKGLKDGSSGFGTVPINTMVDLGGSVAAWDGSTLRGLCSINKDAFQILGVRTIKISDTDTENHKPQTGHYEMTIKCPQTLTYNTGSLYPSNFAPFFVLGWYYEDGSTPAATDVNVVNTTHSILYYKDA